MTSGPVMTGPETTERLTDAVEAALSGAPSGSVVAEAEGFRAEIDVQRADAIGVSVERLRITGAPGGDVAKRADALEKGLSPAGKRLKTIEVDPQLGGAVLRGDLDTRQRYYQADVLPDGVEITRHRLDGQGGREPTEFSLTREQLGEVIEQIQDALEDG